MIIVGGEPPFIEDPEPRFGSVIKKLNQVVMAVQQATVDFNSNNDTKLQTIVELNETFVSQVSVPIDAHLAARGAVHNETKGSIGLGKKDNFRAATKQEQIDLAPVQAFVTPEGAKASIVANTAGFVLADYQVNDLYQFASFYYPDLYPTAPPTVIEPTRYFGVDKKVGMLINNDRLVFSPYSNLSVYQRDSLFTSMPAKSARGGRLGEVPNLKTRYLTSGWNSTGGDAVSGGVSFFKALADKNIYQFKNNLGMAGTNKSYLLYSQFASATYKGLAVSSSVAGTKITLNHNFFYVAAIASDPALTNLIDASYLATFDRFDKASYQGPANGSQTFDMMDYVNLPAGATIEVGAGSHGVVCSLMWNVQNAEIYLHVAVPIIAKINGSVKHRLFSFMMSITPGSLVAGGAAVFKQLGNRAKDTLDTNLLPVGTANWFTQTSRFDLFNPTQYPGVILDGGELIKSCAGKSGVRVKRYTTEYAGVKEFLLAKRPTVDPKLASTELYVPNRHAPFGLCPERIIPYTQDTGQVAYLVYGVNEVTGLFGWYEYGWTTTSPIGAVSGDGTFGIRLPDLVDARENLGIMPESLSIFINKTGTGAALYPLVWNDANGFIAKASFAYANGVVTLGADISMALQSRIVLQSAGAGVLARAAIANPLVNPQYRKVSIQVFKLASTSKVVILISDGLNYAEAALGDYSVVGNQVTLSYAFSNGMKLTQVTTGGQAAVAGNRESQSGDGTWMDCSDMIAARIDANNYNIVFTRPFGNLYGDLSFTVSNVAASLPTFTKGVLNAARLYNGNDAFDTVDYLYPPLAIPNKGAFQQDPATGSFATKMNEVGGTSKVDPFDINEAGWVRLPAGARLVLFGRTIILDKDYAVKVGTSGTYYCYLQKAGTTIIALASTTQREPANNEVLFGIATNGILTLQKGYVVMDGKSISATRHGAAVPYFADDGAQGVNQFFTKRDVKTT